jgi:hypothetical protein
MGKCYGQLSLEERAEIYRCMQAVDLKIRLHLRLTGRDPMVANRTSRVRIRTEPDVNIPSIDKRFRVDSLVTMTLSAGGRPRPAACRQSI